MRTASLFFATTVAIVLASAICAAHAGEAPSRRLSRIQVDSGSVDFGVLAKIISGAIGVEFTQDEISGKAHAVYVVGSAADMLSDSTIAFVATKLERVADTDADGIATLVELRELVDLVQFGILKRQMSATYGPDNDKLQRASSLSESALAAMETDYEALVQRAGELELWLPMATVGR